MSISDKVKFTEAAIEVFCYKKLFLEILQYSQETPVLESFSRKGQLLSPATLIKRDSNTGVFLWLLRNF